MISKNNPAIKSALATLNTDAQIQSERLMDEAERLQKMLENDGAVFDIAAHIKTVSNRATDLLLLAGKMMALSNLPYSDD